MLWLYQIYICNLLDKIKKEYDNKLNSNKEDPFKSMNETSFHQLYSSDIANQKVV